MDNRDLKVALKLKNDYAKARFNEKKELIMIRHNLTVDLLGKRDNIATKRHSERLEILKSRI